MHQESLKNISEFVDSYPAQLLRALTRTVVEEGVELYLVGGTVRDCMLGIPCSDLDLAVSGSAVGYAELVKGHLGGGTLVDLSGPEDEAVRLVWRGLQLDFASFRSGAITIHEDLLLRDFSVNSMAVDFLDLVGEQTKKSYIKLLDPNDGVTDLREGRIRHCPGAFEADPLRILRGYRLCATLGFSFDSKTLEAIRRHASLVQKVAAERISYELQLVFDSSRTTQTLKGMAKSGLLQQLLPELYLGEGVDQPEFHHLDVFDHCFLALQKMEAIIAEPDRFFTGHAKDISSYLQDKTVTRCLKWAALLHDIGKPATKEIRPDKNGRVTFYRHDEVGRELFEQFAARSKWSRTDTELVGSLISMHMHPFHLCNVQREEDISRRAILKLCRRADTSLIGLFILAMSDSLASSGDKKPKGMEEELVTLFSTVWRMYQQNIAPVLRGPRFLTGKELIEEFHLTPGPIFSEILQELEVARVEQKVVDRQSALAWVKAFLLKIGEGAGKDC